MMRLRPGPLYIGTAAPAPHPEGWGMLVCDNAGIVLAGWDHNGSFYSWAPTEDLVRVLLQGMGLDPDQFSPPSATVKNRTTPDA